MAQRPTTDTEHERGERARVAIERIEPEIDAGRFPIHRVPGEEVAVQADVFAEGHDVVFAGLEHRVARAEADAPWIQTRMRPLGNDRFTGSFVAGEPGIVEYRVTGWIDRFATWRRNFEKTVAAGLDPRIELLAGALLVEAAAARAGAPARLRELAARLGDATLGESERAAAALAAELSHAMLDHGEREGGATSRVLRVTVAAPLARFCAWYEMFPRSRFRGGLADGAEADREPEPAAGAAHHGTFRAAERVLPYVAAMGFDVLYLPPIHPIGRTHRRGRNNTAPCRSDDVGSPWAIGAAEGGHTSVHPDLGTLADFRRFAARARALGLEVALDVAFQCSPDHPWVREHPGWFRRRPDGSIRYAENPPKQYRDIYPLDFGCADRDALWRALRDVFLFWVGEGVRVFRVDNPHTKPLPFWEWCLREVRDRRPDAVFLSEAFTRPKVMMRLAKLGFDQSYTYFTWKNTKHDLVAYFTELTSPPVRDFFQPNLWPNTPDILNEYLQVGGRAAFQVRVLLAATLSSAWGMYGPAFELCEARPREPGSEEYLDSEKYQIREWDLDDPRSLRDLVTRLNRARRENPALQRTAGLVFHAVDNPSLVAYSRASADGRNAVLCIVNLDPAHAQSGFVELDLEALGLPEGASFQVHDLIGEARYLWNGARNYVALDPAAMPGHVFRVRRRVRSEQDFEYFA